jgi:Tfp pilus assembly protein PilO
MSKYEIEGYFKVNGVKDSFTPHKKEVMSLENYRKELEQQNEGYKIMFKYKTKIKR